MRLISHSKMYLASILLCSAAVVLGVPLQEEPRNVRTALSPRIIGGQVANAGQFPFLVAINKHTSDGLFFCGGALLTRQWVITAGQCVDGAILFDIRLGSNSLDATDPNLVRLSTDSYVLHPEYNPLTLENDVGVIQFRLPITLSDYIKTINLLPSVVLSDRSALVTMGWGQTSDEDGSIQDRIYYVSVTTIPNPECKLYYGNQIIDSMACAEGNYNEGTCYGDIGGPLIQYVSRGQTMLVGVSSFVSQNGCESTDPSGYTRSFDYVDWIKTTTGFI